MTTLKDTSVYNNMKINKNMKGLKDMAMYNNKKWKQVIIWK